MTTLSLNAAPPDDAGPEGRDVPRFSWVEKAIAYVVAGLIAYGAIQSRIAVLEVRYEQTARDVAEIKADIKTLIRASGGGGSR